jgi:amino acid adenylation domain-containing protein
VTVNEPLRKDVEAIDFDPFAGVEIEATVPTTEPQKEVWLSSQLGPDASCAYNESLAIELAGKLEVDALETALNQVVARHDALRATISADGESVCIGKNLRVALPLEDWSRLDSETQFRDLAAIKCQEVSNPFDLFNGPLLRARLIRLAPERHIIVLTAHHIICDGWSFEPLLSDFSQFYSAEIAGTEAKIGPAESLVDYAQRHVDPDYLEEIQTSQQYWLQRFRNIPPQTEFTADRPRPKQRSFDADFICRLLPADLIQRLKDLGAAHGCSLMTTLMSGFEVFVSRLTGNRELVIAVPSAGQVAFDCPSLIGHCVNLLPVRTRIEPELNFAEYLLSRRSQMLADFDHQKFTYGSLIKNLQIGRDPSRMPLTSIMFNIDQPLEGIKFEGLEYEVSSNPRRFEAFEQFFNLSMREKGVVVECQYNRNLFDSDLMQHRLEAFQALLESIVGDPDQKISALQMLSSRQLDMITKQWAENSVSAIPYATCVEAFSQVVAESGDKVALTSGSSPLTYAELDRLTDKISRSLASRGVGSGARVGVLLQRSEKLPVSLLGVLRSGAIYVPLDPELPGERLAYICSDSGIALIIHDQETEAQLPDGSEAVSFDRLVSEQNAAALPVAPTAEASAYLIYTSGSTGQPKGVEVSHGNLANFLSSMANEPGLCSDDRLLAVTTSSFDISMLEMLGPLMVGGEIVIADQSAVKDPLLLIDLIQRKSPTVMQATPSSWRMLREADWQGSTGMKILCGGEALDAELANWMLGRCRALWNMYGPTETTIWSTCKHLTDDESVTLGRAINNTQVYVLDEQQRPLLPGSSGELYIGGAGVSKGYWNRAELTAEKFIESDLSPHGRIYATGDAVRFLTDGQLEYLGRLDNQVKLRGYRIELGDVEAALQRYPAVLQAIAAVRDFGANDSRLIGYVKLREGAVLEAKQLREFVAEILPAYMLPQHIVEVTAFPLTANRKIDRKVLPMPVQESAVGESGPDNEPQTPTQVALAEIWRDVLGLSFVGRRDDFFDLGGHSILVTRVVARINQKLGLELPLRRFFESPVLEDIADALDALGILVGEQAWRSVGDLEELEI